MDNLFAGIWPSPDEKNQSTAKLSRAGLFRWVESGSLPGWQLCRGISGSFRVEWVAGFVWNQWQPWSGIRRRSLAAIMEAPEFVTGVDREMLGKFRGLMEEQHAPDVAAKRKVFEADVETAQVAIEQASRVAQDVLQIKDVDSAVDDRQRVAEAQEQFKAAIEE